MMEFNADEVFELENYLYFYKDLLSDERTEKEINFLSNKLQLSKKPKKILDIACGHGRHSVKLAARGHEVVGIDIKKDLLNIARDLAKEQGVKVEFRKEDMRKMNFKEDFDVALLLFTSFGYFSDDENFKVLRNIYKALRPGGLFCLDMPNRDSILKNFEKYHKYEKENNLMIDSNFFDITTGRLNTERTIIKDGRRKDIFFSVRLYTFTELKSFLRETGFNVCKTFGNWEGEKLSTKTRRMIIVSQKPLR